jgi:thiamine pyrophosphate-dependent acetolactate synthase large subunit-like protein
LGPRSHVRTGGVIAFQADGSGLYTLQALWSMSRESADVTIVVCANRRYRILQAELARARYRRARTQGMGTHRSHATGDRLGCTGEGIRHAGL